MVLNAFQYLHIHHGVQKTLMPLIEAYSEPSPVRGPSLMATWTQYTF